MCSAAVKKGTRNNQAADAAAEAEAEEASKVAMAARGKAQMATLPDPWAGADGGDLSEEAEGAGAGSERDEAGAGAGAGAGGGGGGAAWVDGVIGGSGTPVAHAGNNGRQAVRPHS